MLGLGLGDRVRVEGNNIVRGGEPFNSVQGGGLFHVVSKYQASHPRGKFRIRPLVVSGSGHTLEQINYFDTVIRTRESKYNVPKSVSQAVLTYAVECNPPFMPLRRTTSRRTSLLAWYKVMSA